MTEFGNPVYSLYWAPSARCDNKLAIVVIISKAEHPHATDYYKTPAIVHPVIMPGTTTLVIPNSHSFYSHQLCGACDILWVTHPPASGWHFTWCPLLIYAREMQESKRYCARIRRVTDIQSYNDLINCTKTVSKPRVRLSLHGGLRIDSIITICLILPFTYPRATIQWVSQRGTGLIIINPEVQ